MSSEGTWQGYPLPGGRGRLMCDVGDVPDHTRLEMPTAEDFEARARERGVPLRGVHDAHASTTSEPSSTRSMRGFWREPRLSPRRPPTPPTGPAAYSTG